VLCSRTTGCPPDSAKLLPQMGAPQAAVPQQQHPQGGRHGRLERLHQGQHRGQPGARLVGRQDTLRHGDGTAPIEPAKHRGHHPLAMYDGIQCQRLPLPPRDDSAQQGGNAARNVELRMTWGGFSGPLIAPRAQALAHGMPGPVGQQGRHDRLLARTLGQDGAVASQSQAPRLGQPQVRKMGNHGLGHMVPCRWKAHEHPPTLLVGGGPP
jgi:hypothetical protein